MLHLSLNFQAHLTLQKTQSYRYRRPLISASVALETGVQGLSSPPNSSVLWVDQSKERIRKLFNEVDYSVSAYDTAWVAMVPDPHSSQAPLFPKCLNWLLGSQLHDGSWSLPHHHPLLLKDVLSSTLACVLALKTWGIGEEHIKKGVRFIELNFALASEECQFSPVGFDIIFPGMLDHARDLSLGFQLEPKLLNDLIHKRDMELGRICESHSKKSEAFLAYVSEGLLKLQNWDMAMKFQRKNGSLFNSPSATAAAAINVQNPSCLNYLYSVIDKFGPAVPAVYPLDIYARLCLVDNLEKMGISQYFTNEIQCVLDDTYRCWLQGEEDIFAETSHCALAFRLLRKHGYDISSDPLIGILEDESASSYCCNGSWNEVNALVEVYQASQMAVHENESALEKQNLLSKHLLRQHIFNGCDSKGFPNQIFQQVEYLLNFPSPLILPRVEIRKNIEHYNVDSGRILKTLYRSSNLGNEDLLRLAVRDFNHCQLIHRNELEEIERWYTQNRLHELKFTRHKAIYGFFSAAATIFSPELYEARMSWAKNCVLTTVTDDFFDVGGSEEELRNLIDLLERWDVNISSDCCSDISSDCCSENVQIVFSALRSTISETGEKASKLQGRNVTSHTKEIWLELLYGFFREFEWTRDKTVPTLDEYMANAYVSFALGPIMFPAIYLRGPKLSEEVARHPEMRSLYKHVSNCGRLLNDMRGFERERKEGKLNSVTLRLSPDGTVSEAAAIAEVKLLIENERRRLLRLVLQKDGSVVPRACKDMFWNLSRILHQFYFNNDGFTSEVEMVDLVKAIIHKPIPLEDFE
ncbi:ent-kaurene synthase TSP4, chloroplastic-like [Coffea arabica]|uniref:Ent-kaurene synthase TSP4, chloroplastic-like n=1 Tax=Coffea arabica TaxID=13443 RepID=A0A6P6TGU2_COFAR